MDDLLWCSIYESLRGRVKVFATGNCAAAAGPNLQPINIFFSNLRQSKYNLFVQDPNCVHQATVWRPHVAAFIMQIENESFHWQLDGSQTKKTIRGFTQIKMIQEKTLYLIQILLTKMKEWMKNLIAAVVLFKVNFRLTQAVKE